MGKGRRIRMVALPGFEEDLRALHAAAKENRHRSEGRLLRVVLSELQLIAQGEPGTHRLDYMPGYPDISDCETTYVWSEQGRMPTHRLVWRERVPGRPAEPNTREVIALGERAGEHAYYLAGQRLGRPVGITLAELRAQSEPVATLSRSREQPIDTRTPATAEADVELG